MINLELVSGKTNVNDRIDGESGLVVVGGEFRHADAITTSKGI